MTWAYLPSFKLTSIEEIVKASFSSFVELKKYSFITVLMNDGMMISEIKNAYILRNLFW